MSIQATLAMLQARNDSVTGVTSANLLVDTTIAVVNSQTSFTLTAGSTVDDAYNGYGVALLDASASNALSGHIISDYVGATKTVTLDSTPGFTILAGDGVKVPEEWPESELSASNFPQVLTRKAEGQSVKLAGKQFSTDTWQIYVFLARQHQETFAQAGADANTLIHRFRDLYTDALFAGRVLQASPYEAIVLNHQDGNIGDSGLIEIEYLSKIYYGFRFDVVVTEREL